MSIVTRESLFEYQAKEILLKALSGQNIEELDNVDEFNDEIWKDKILLAEIARAFIEGVQDFSGDKIFEEVMEKLAEDQYNEEEFKKNML